MKANNKDEANCNWYKSNNEIYQAKKTNTLTEKMFIENLQDWYELNYYEVLDCMNNKNYNLLSLQGNEQTKEHAEGILLTYKQLAKSAKDNLEYMEKVLNEGV